MKQLPNRYGFTVFSWLVLPVFLAFAGIKAVAQESAEIPASPSDIAQINTILQKLENDIEYITADQKLAAAQEAAQLSEKAGYKNGLAKSYYFIGNCYRVANKNTESVDFLTRAVNISYQIGDSVTYAFANIRLSSVNRKLGNMEEAFRQVYKALAIAENSKNNQLLFPGYSQLASLFVINNQLEKGLEYYNKAAGVSRKENNSEWLAMTYNNLGITHYRAKNHKKALGFYIQSEKLNRESGKKIFLLDNYINMGAAYQDIGKKKEAETAFRKALKLAEELGNREEQRVIILTDMGVYANLNNDHTIAIAYYKEALELAKQLNAKPYITQIYQNMATSYYEMKLYKEANDARINFSAYKDSLDKESRVEQLAEMESKYETEKKSKQIALLQKDNQIKQDRISRRTLERNASFAVLFLGLLVSVLIFRMYRQRQRTAVLLAAKNEEINKQQTQELLKIQQLKSMHALMDGLEEERNRIAADLHDRVGSMLATVKLHFKSAELALADRPELLSDAGILLDESIQEVRRISHNIVSGVLMKFGLVAAINDLKKSLCSSGQIDMKVTVYGMENRLPQELEVPVYRIVQELVNNTIKHAGASKINIQISRFDDLLNIVVEDNGKGFDPEDAKKNSEGLGLANISTRLHKLHGTLNIDSGLGNGSTFIIDVPLKTLEQPDSNPEENILNQHSSEMHNV